MSSRVSLPLIRSVGRAPAVRCRSEAFSRLVWTSRSVISTGLPPASGSRFGEVRPLRRHVRPNMPNIWMDGDRLTSCVCPEEMEDRTPNYPGTEGGRAEMMLSSGKLANLLRLADAAGRFKMLAVDQRDSMRAALAKAAGRQPQDVAYEDMAATKALITDLLSPHSTATLVDPIYGLPRAVKIVPGDVGLLVAVEDGEYDQVGPTGRERKTRLLDGWSVAQAKRSGVNAIKLLLYD